MFNRITIAGYLGKDPEQRFTGSGDNVCNFSVATSEKWTDASGAAQERTEWFSIQAWRKLGENCHKYLAKGRPVLVEGKLRTREYEHNGVKRTAVEVIADRVVFLPHAGADTNRGSAARPDAAPPPSDDDVPF